MPDTGGIILFSDAIYTVESPSLPVKPSISIYDSVGYNSTVKNIYKEANEKN